ncbi:hypothetical protein E4T47_03311 [Aureobasidium subglaciale]|nr:hypothetical protein E4T47_03311 [Aureobasidium subglaciale]
MPPTTALAIMPPRKVPPHRRYAKKFLTLPNEFLIKISDCVAPEDISNFRFACKKRETVSGKHFGDKRLAHRRFIFTQYSMEGLVEMTAHQVFGPCVKSVLFDILVDALTARKITDDMKAMEVIREYRKRWYTRCDFMHGHLLEMLQAVISNLQFWGNNVNLGIFDRLQRSSMLVSIDGRPQWCSRLVGYGANKEYSALPFVKLAASTVDAFNIVYSICF